MNRLEDLKGKRCKVAVLGVNQHGLDAALSISKRYLVQITDKNIKPDALVEEFLMSRGIPQDSVRNKYSNISIVKSTADLRSAGVYYLNGLSTSLVDWTEIKTMAAQVGSALKPGDWVIFGEDIEPDLAEVVLLDILEIKSGLSLGQGFELAFSPKSLRYRNFANLGNEMKMSHNLIINQVEEILDQKHKDKFTSNQINYLDEEKELSRIHSKIKELWVPMLNEMDSTTFNDFVEQTNKGFLNVYSHLRFSNEIKVNYYRFFKIAKKYGLKHSVAKLSQNSGWSTAV
ncbi:MAG: hypothetical protein DA405_10775 [Bacteroidetes bacterium]|nr:MAG: hypothetical protein DA405_10775 [Bacteroidota bacterium]